MLLFDGFRNPEIILFLNEESIIISCCLPKKNDTTTKIIDFGSSQNVYLPLSVPTK
jgi:hypothetical protein